MKNIEPLAKETHWTTADEVNFVRNIMEMSNYIRTPKKWMLLKYKASMGQRKYWGEIDKGIVQKCVENEIKKV